MWLLQAYTVVGGQIQAPDLAMTSEPPIHNGYIPL